MGHGLPIPEHPIKDHAAHSAVLYWRLYFWILGLLAARQVERAFLVYDENEFGQFVEGGCQERMVEGS